MCLSWIVLFCSARSRLWTINFLIEVRTNAGWTLPDEPGPKRFQGLTKKHDQWPNAYKIYLYLEVLLFFFQEVPSPCIYRHEELNLARVCHYPEVEEWKPKSITSYKDERSVFLAYDIMMVTRTCRAQEGEAQHIRALVRLEMVPWRSISMNEYGGDCYATALLRYLGRPTQIISHWPVWQYIGLGTGTHGMVLRPRSVQSSPYQLRFQLPSPCDLDTSAIL